MICATDTELKTIIAIIQKYAADCDVFVYGSRHNGNPKSYSDIDLAFKLPNGQPLEIRRIGILQEAFAESTLPYRTDIVDYNAVEFRAVIDAGCEMIAGGGLNNRILNVGAYMAARPVSEANERAGLAPALQEQPQGLPPTHNIV